MANKNLSAAKKAKNDEFYTQLTDIEKELKHYKKQLRNKIIFCNCDDPEESNFYKYFKLNFLDLKLKKVITTHFDSNQPTYKIELWEENRELKEVKTPLEGNGDFRSQECIDILKTADIVVTNPPFSLFREYIAQLVEYDKKFLVIGNQNAITYKEIFPLIKDNKIWLGISPRSMNFITPSGDLSCVNACWFTNLDHKKRHEELESITKYDPLKNPKYDNYDAIEVSKVAEIPYDYQGVMGVPITFLDKYNPEQFEIVGWSRHNDLNMDGGYWIGGNNDATVNGKLVYRRLLIKHKQ